MLAGDLIDIFDNHVPGHGACELAELRELITSFLLIRAHSHIQSTFHDTPCNTRHAANNRPFVFVLRPAIRWHQFSMTYETATAHRFLAGNRSSLLCLLGPSCSGCFLCALGSFRCGHAFRRNCPTMLPTANGAVFDYHKLSFGMNRAMLCHNSHTLPLLSIICNSLNRPRQRWRYQRTRLGLRVSACATYAAARISTSRDIKASRTLLQLSFTIRWKFGRSIGLLVSRSQIAESSPVISVAIP
jgi:hypothetical protein